MGSDAEKHKQSNYRQAYDLFQAVAGAAERLILSAEASSSEQVAKWLVEQLRGK